MNFTDLPLVNPLLKALEKVDFTTPTPIQQEVIPEALL
jgi:ATP-dependent RNA helicase RhlE